MYRILAAAVLLAAAVPATAAPLSFTLSSSGLSVRAGTRALVTGSCLVAVEPPWVQHRFYIRQAKVSREVSGSDDSLRISLASDDPRYPFKLKEYSAAATPDGLCLTVDGGINEPLPTAVEYTACVVPGNLLAGAIYTATLADGTTKQGRIASLPGADTAALPPFQKVTFRTPFGSFSLNVTEGAPLSMQDRRARTYDDQRCFWIGIQGEPVTPEKRFRQVTRLQFDPQERLAGPQPLPTTAPGAPATPAIFEPVKNPAAVDLPLLPPPHERADGAGVYTPMNGDPLWLAPGKGEDYGRLKQAARRIVLERMSLPLKLSTSRRTPQRGVRVWVTGGGTSLPTGARVPEQAEGYWLRVDDTGAQIVGRDARGAFYGLQTLRMLARAGKIPATEIRDWPDYSMRGLHLLADSASLSFHGNLIENLLAPLKMNHIVFEVEYAKWDSTRELHQPWGMSKQDMRALAKLAQDNFIEITPLVQTLGHCEWLFQNKQHYDWSEDPEKRYAYDASNPAVYRYMEKLLDEVRSVFPSHYLHIGHDEVSMTGQYPLRPANVAKGAPQVILDDILWYHRYAQRHGLRLMMWHDMLITKKEGTVANGGAPLNTAAIRPRLPKDIVLVDWQYSPQKSYPEAPLLRGEGFDVVGATWSAPGNVEQFAAYGRDKGLLGMIDTTWTGYHGNATALRENFEQIAAYVRSGDWFWNAAASERPRYHDGDVLSHMVPTEERDPFPQAENGRVLDLSPSANLSLTDAANPFGLGDALGLQSMPLDAQWYGPRRFRVAQRDGVPAAVSVRSALTPNLPPSVDVLANPGKAKGFLFLHTTALIGKTGEEIGRYVVHYADGTEAVIPVRYEQEIGYPASEGNYYLSSPAYTWDYNGRTLRLWAMEWKNPHPDRAIASLSLQSTGSEAAPVLLAATAVQ